MRHLLQQNWSFLGWCFRVIPARQESTLYRISLLLKPIPSGNIWHCSKSNFNLIWKKIILKLSWNKHTIFCFPFDLWYTNYGSRLQIGSQENFCGSRNSTEFDKQCSHSDQHRIFKSWHTHSAILSFFLLYSDSLAEARLKGPKPSPNSETIRSRLKRKKKKSNQIQ